MRVAAVADTVSCHKAKAFLNYYYQSVYQSNLEELELTNDKLPKCIDELRTYIGYVRSGEWTSLSELPESSNSSIDTPLIFSIDGKPVTRLGQRGLYIIYSPKGKVQKVLR